MSTTAISGSLTLGLPAIGVQSVNGAAGVAQLINSLANLTSAVPLTVGTSAGQVAVPVVLPLLVTSGTPYTINLNSGGTDQFGNPFTMTKLRCALLVNGSTTLAQIFTIGGGTNPVFGTDKLQAEASGGIAFFYRPTTGYAVVGSSSDTVTVTVASGTSVSATLVLLGI